MKPKVAIIISSPMMVNFFLISQINHLCEKFEITLITGISDNDVALNEDKINKKIKEEALGIMTFFKDFNFFSIIRQYPFQKLGFIV